MWDKGQMIVVSSRSKLDKNTISVVCVWGGGYYLCDEIFYYHENPMV